MTRHVSGTYQRTDRVRAPAGATVLLRTEAEPRSRSVQLLEFSLSDMRLSGLSVMPEAGSAVAVTIVLPDRYVEFEIPAVVAWQHGDELTITFDYLSARQTYGLALALELVRKTAAKTPALVRSARR